METKEPDPTSEHEAESYDSIFDWFDAQTERFGQRIDMTKLALFGSVIILCIILLTFPKLIPADMVQPRTIRFIALGVITVFGVLVFFSHHTYYNIKTGDSIKNLVCKAFDLRRVDLTKLREAVQGCDFEFLSKTPAEKDGKAVLRIFVDFRAETAFMMLTSQGPDKKWHAQTQVIEITGSAFQRSIEAIRSI